MSITVCRLEGREVTVHTVDPEQAAIAAAIYWNREDDEEDGASELFIDWLLDHEFSISPNWHDAKIAEALQPDQLSSQSPLYHLDEDESY